MFNKATCVILLKLVFAAPILVQSIRLDDFFPYDAELDVPAFQKCAHKSICNETIELSIPFDFCSSGQPVKKLRISSAGIIDLFDDDDASLGAIVVLDQGQINQKLSKVFYRQTFQSSIFAQAKRDLLKRLGDLQYASNFELNWAFIITFLNVVPLHDSSTLRSNTFQAIIVADTTARLSFAIFYYSDVNFFSASPRHAPRHAGYIGQSCLDGSTWLRDQPTKFPTTSNIKQPGKFVFLLDTFVCFVQPQVSSPNAFAISIYFDDSAYRMSPAMVGTICLAAEQCSSVQDFANANKCTSIDIRLRGVIEYVNFEVVPSTHQRSPSMGTLVNRFRLIEITPLPKFVAGISLALDDFYFSKRSIFKQCQPMGQPTPIQLLPVTDCRPVSKLFAPSRTGIFTTPKTTTPVVMTTTMTAPSPLSCNVTDEKCRAAVCGKIPLSPNYRWLRDACSLCDESVDFICNLTKKCIEISKLCNGRFDCSDGSDEANCPHPGSCGLNEQSSRKKVARTRRLVDGTLADRKEIPWQVYFEGVISTSGTTILRTCGAAVISETILLTAARCCDNTVPSASIVALGFIDLDNLHSARIRNISNFVIHPNYTSGNNDFDYCLIHLAEPISLSTWYVQTICLPQTQYDCERYCSAGTTAQISGWCRTSTDENSESRALLKGEVRIESSSQCREHFANDSITDGMFCAGGDSNSAQGDAGGPLTILASGRRYMCGLSSWGRLGGKSQRHGHRFFEGYGYSSVYARICPILNWIETEALTAMPFLHQS